MVALCPDVNLNHYLSSYVFSIFCRHVSPSRQDPLCLVHTVSLALNTVRACSRCSDLTCRMSEWEVPFVASNSPGSRVDAGVASLGRGTCRPFLARAVGGFHFRFCLPRHLPAPLHSLTWSMTDYLLTDWDFLVDIMHPFFSNDANSIIFIALCTAAFLDGRPIYGLPCF